MTAENFTVTSDDTFGAIMRDAQRYRWLRQQITADSAEVGDFLAEQDPPPQTPEAFDSVIDKGRERFPVTP